MLNRLFAPFAGADANAVVERQYENLAVADLAGGPAAAPFDDRLDRRFDEVLVDGDLQLHLAQQIDRELVAAVDLGMALLTAEALHVHDRQPKDLDFGQGRFDRFQAAGLDDGDNQLHARLGWRGMRLIVAPKATPLKGLPRNWMAASAAPNPTALRKKERPDLGGLGGASTQVAGASFWPRQRAKVSKSICKTRVSIAAGQSFT